MSDRPLKILLIDPDPIFRLGLRVAIEAIPDWQIVAEVETDTAAWQILAEISQQEPNRVNLVVLELGNGRSRYRQQVSLQFCQQLRAVYPHLPILLLSAITDQRLLSASQVAGVTGYCPKGTPTFELVAIMERVATGDSVWLEEREISNLNPPHLPFSQVRNNLRLSGIDYINATLTDVTAQLRKPGLRMIDQAILAGKRRELLAARWLLDHVLASPHERQTTQQQSIPAAPSLSSAITQTDTQEISTLPSLLSPRALQAELFTACITKLQFPLQNITDTPLEVDILQETKKRELLYIILQKLAQQLEELRDLQPESYQLVELKTTIINDLWQAAVTEFYGKFSRVKIGNRNIEIVKFLLSNFQPIQTEILDKIPLVVDLLSYLLLKTNLDIDNASYSADSVEAKSQALRILENLLIQVANAVLQPLLNNLADVEVIKQSYYDRQLISTREIEKFRNNLSWKYRLNSYVTEAQAIFESRYDLFVLSPRGIAKVSIYAPRNQELAQLSGVSLLVTLLLEFRDAIAPRIQSLLAFFGSGIVFILTQVIGRGLGLIGRGILQGIGNVSFTEKSLKKK
jgi:DNA-binding NarL/FixJ family response regulator